MKGGAREHRDQQGADRAVVLVDPGQSLDRALKQFKRSVDRAGILREAKQREFFTPPSARRRLKSIRARKRDAKAAAKRAHALTLRSDEHTKDDAQ